MIEIEEYESGQFRGNHLLKRPGVIIEWTEQLKNEWLRCAEDPIYFIENYMRIVNPDGVIVAFKLYDYQKEIIYSYLNNRNTIVATARQAGKSTTTCGFILWYIIFQNNRNVAILANKAEIAQEILSRIQFAYEGLPKWIQQGVTTWNKRSVVLENGSKIRAAATSKTAIRGFSVNFLFIDEAAHIDKWNEFYTSSAETISSGKETKVALVSTPNGLNHFWQFWDNALSKNNGYHPIRVTWNMVPGRDEKWKHEALQRLNFDYEKFRQEHECIFKETEIILKCKKTDEIIRTTVENAFNILNPSTNIHKNVASFIRKNHLFEILTPNGWKDFDGIKKTKRNGSIKIILENNILICTPEHPIKTQYGFVSAKELTTKHLIQTQIGLKPIIDFEFSDKPAIFYDVLGVKDGNEYFSNDIVSHNCEFLGSSGTLIAGWKLQQMKPTQPIIEHAKLKQFERPIKDRIYACVCDVSRGKGMDYSAFSVIDVSSMPYKQVCTFKDNMISPVEYAEVIFHTAKSYNEAAVLIEINDIGGQIGDIMHYEYEYENLLQTESAGRAGKKISFGFNKLTDRGIRTTKTVKTLGCAILKLLIEQDKLLIPDSDTILELAVFSKKGDAYNYEAEEGKHDDLVMGLVLFGWLTEQNYFKELNNINTLARLREKSEEQLMDDLTPFGFISDGRDLTENQQF